MAITKDDIKIYQSLLYISYCLIKRADQEISEKFLIGNLAKPDDVLMPISLCFRKLYPSAVADVEISPLFYFSMRIWGDYDHYFRNLWGANGQIAVIQGNLDTDFVINSDSKKALKIKTLRLAEKKKFWDSLGSTNENLLFGVVYDIERKCLVVSNDDVFRSHIEKWYARVYPHDASTSIVEKIEKLVCRYMHDHYKLLDGQEKEQLVQFAKVFLEGVPKTESNQTPNSNAGDEMRPTFKIYYGPPGTGKTRKAKLDVNGAGDQFSKIVQIHPSSSYEDIVEGTRPVGFSDGVLRYDVVDGPIKIMARKATGEYFSTLCSLSIRGDLVEVSMPLGTSLRYDLGKSALKFSDLSGSSLEAKAPQSDTFQIPISDFKAKFKEVFERIPNDDSKGDRIYDRVMVKDVNWGQRRPYVLIFDEINRGNVASILGEMIFVIGETEAGSLERKKVTLQYSQEKFEWPANLNLIGTMNSTDISIDKIDQAIKRRFQFEEVEPNYEIFDKDNGAGKARIFEFLPESTSINKYFEAIGQNPQSIMKSINTALIDHAAKKNAFNVKDKLIGQSFFIKFARRIAEIREGLIPIGVNHDEAFGNVLKIILEKDIRPALLNVFNGDRKSMEEFLTSYLKEWSSNFGYKRNDNWSSGEPFKKVG